MKFGGYDISIRAEHVLRNLGIQHPLALSRFTAESLATIPNCGKRTVEELREILKAHHLSFVEPRNDRLLAKINAKLDRLISIVDK